MQPSPMTPVQQQAIFAATDARNLPVKELFDGRDRGVQVKLPNGHYRQFWTVRDWNSWVATYDQRHDRR